MRGVLLGFSLLPLTGCQLGKGSTVSEWTALEAASSTSCDRWPIQEKDLEISDISVVRAADGTGRGFLATGIGRTGESIHYYVPFTGSTEIEPDSLRSLKLGRTALLVGGQHLAQAHAGVIQNLASKAVLEVRRVPENVVRFKTDLFKGEVESGLLTMVGGDAWVTYMDADRRFRLLWLGHGGKGFASRQIENLTFPERPRLVAEKGGAGVLALWEEGQAIKVRRVGRDGKTLGSETLDLKLEGGLESWSVAARGQGYYLAYVDGDSLVGESSLRVAYFDWNGTSASIRWTKETPLQDVHLTEPVVASSEDGLEILLLTWVDAESTIGRYHVTELGVEPKGYVGIFPKGSRILEAFPGPDGDLYAIVRHKDGMRWAFDICQL